MLNYGSAIQLLHRHDDGSASEMTERTSDELDPERSLLKGLRRGARIFRCEACSDEVIVQPSADEDSGSN